jgi:SAM-dependent methyltransferase
MKISQMRCLDIGCLEGGFSLTLGMIAAEVVGLDIRPENLIKAEFARSVLRQDNVRFVQGDMHKLDDYDLGAFDLIIASGVLYHVEAFRIHGFLAGLRRRCRGMLLVDTHVATSAKSCFSEGGYDYHGRVFVEFDDALPKTSWSSMDNQHSFWLTERSLTNALVDAGFEFVIKPMSPTVEYPWKDRVILCAFDLRGADVSTDGGQPFVVRLPEPDSRADYHPMLDHPSQIAIDGPVQAPQHCRLSLDDDLLPPIELMRTEVFPIAEEWFSWGDEWKSILRGFGRLRSHGKVLEIGCGLGRIAFSLRKYLDQGEYQGFDVRKDAIDFLRRKFTSRYGNFSFSAADVFNGHYNPNGTVDGNKFTFPYPSEEFDIVFAASVFDHLLPGTLSNYFAETRRVLRPHGRLVASFFFVENLRSVSARAPGFESRDFLFENRYGDYGGDVRVANGDNPEKLVAHSLDYLDRIAKENGLRILTTFPGSWSGLYDNTVSTLDLAIFVKDK